MDKCLLSLNNTGVIYSSASKFGLLLAVTTTTAASEVSAASIKPFSESSVSRALAHSTTTLLLLPLCLYAVLYWVTNLHLAAASWGSCYYWCSWRMYPPSCLCCCRWYSCTSMYHPISGGCRCRGRRGHSVLNYQQKVKIQLLSEDVQMASKPKIEFSNMSTFWRK